MAKLIFKTITSPRELDLVLDKIEHFSGVRLPLDYVKRSKTVGVFLQDKLVASYMLVTKPNFRSLAFVPDSIKRSHSFFKKSHYEMMEVNGLWIGPAVRSPQMQFKIWMNLAKDVFFSKKKYVLLMRNSKNRSIAHLHSMTNPEVLYQGVPYLMAGGRTHSDIQVSYTTRWNIVFNFPKYLLELRSRALRAKEFSINHTAVHSYKDSDAEFV